MIGWRGKSLMAALKTGVGGALFSAEIKSGAVGTIESSQYAAMINSPGGLYQCRDLDTVSCRELDTVISRRDAKGWEIEIWSMAGW